VRLPDIPGYEISRELGRGGMARVYQATQLKFGRQVALKVMLPHFAETPGAAERFLAEGRMTAGLNHPNILSMFDIGCHEAQYFLAAELLPGGTLSELAPSFFTLEHKLRTVRGIARGLGYAHAHQIVHRDIKPVNILFRDANQPVITDFGIAKALGEPYGVHTQTGTVLGTPHYMSPEQAQGLPLDGRSDWYSLGVVLFELLAGHKPFDAPDPIAILFKHLQDPIPELPDELGGLQPIVSKLMAKSRDARYQSANELVDALSPWINRSAALVIPSVSGVPTEPLHFYTCATPAAQPPLANTTPTQKMTEALPPAAASTQAEAMHAPAPRATSPYAAPVPMPMPATSLAQRWTVLSWPRLLLCSAVAILGLSWFLLQPPVVQRPAEQTLAQADGFAPDVQLLALVRTRIAAGELIEPEGNAALDLLENYLRERPSAPEALQLLQDIAEALVAKAKASIQADDRAAAFALLAKANQRFPNHAALQELSAELQLAIDRREASEAASSSTGGNQGDLLVRAQRLMDEGKRVYPPGDNAVVLLNQLLEKDANNAQALQLLQQIARDYERVARTWQSRGRNDFALQATTNGLAARPNDEALLQLKAELARP
jgi:hypothetical protein